MEERGTKRSADEIDGAQIDQKVEQKELSQPQPELRSPSHIVFRSPERYFDGEVNKDDVPQVTLTFPFGEETFPLVAPIAKSCYNPLVDLVRHVWFVVDTLLRDRGITLNRSRQASVSSDVVTPAEDEAEQLVTLARQIERGLKKQTWPLVQDLCARLNARVTTYKASEPVIRHTKWTLDQTMRLLDLLYDRCVTMPQQLNKYESFSHKVYGETKPQLIHQMIEKDVKEAFAACKVFVDLGSGIGNVVFQVALETDAKCYGVELMPIPAGYARDQLAEFKHCLTLLGHPTDRAHLREGDFLEDPKIVKLIEKANIVFVNNYAFGSEVDHALGNLFLGLKDGAKIINLKSFRPLDWRVTDWNVGDFASILRVERFGYGEGSVSWTSSVGEYYVQTVDRSEVQKFLKQNKRRHQRT